MLKNETFISLYLLIPLILLFTRLKDHMLRITISLFLSLIVLNAYGQREVLVSKLKEYNIPGDYIVNALKDEDAKHYYKFKSVTWLPSKHSMEEIIEEGEFNPVLPVGEKWKLLKLNGEKATKKEANKFSNEQNTIKNNVNAEIAGESFKIAEDNENQLIVSLKYKKETLPKRYKFLSECTALIYFDKNQKRLTKIEYTNDYPVKVWIYKATGLELTQYYAFNENENQYFITREEMDIQSNYMGKGISIIFEIDYSDYKKVK